MKKRVNISLDEDTADAIKELAEQSNRNVSQWITDKVWADYSARNTGSSTMQQYYENGDLADFAVEYGIKMCPKCRRKYKQRTEEQVPGFRDRDYDNCPYCGAENGSSMQVEFYNSKIGD